MSCCAKKERFCAAIREVVDVWEYDEMIMLLSLLGVVACWA